MNALEKIVEEIESMKNDAYETLKEEKTWSEQNSRRSGRFLQADARTWNEMVHRQKLHGKDELRRVQRRNVLYRIRSVLIVSVLH